MKKLNLLFHLEHQLVVAFLLREAVDQYHAVVVDLSFQYFF